MKPRSTGIDSGVRKVTRNHRLSSPRLLAYAAIAGVLTTMAMSLAGCGPSLDTPAAASSPSPSAVQDFNNADALRRSNPPQCNHAIPLYLSALMKDSAYVNAYVGLAGCYQIIGSLNGAIEEYNKAIQVDPTNFGLYIGRAGAETVSGNTGAATSDDLIALQLAPHQARSYVTIAQSLSSFGDFADAITAMNKAIALVPGDPSLYETRAGIYQTANDYRSAFADYERAIKIAPFTARRAQIYADEAGVYDSEGDFNSAYAAIASAIALQPDITAFYIQSGNIHRDGGAFQAALKLYDHALHIATNNGDAETAHEDKGDTLMMMGQPRPAIAEYRQASRLAAKKDPVIQPRLKDKITQAQQALSRQ